MSLFFLIARVIRTAYRALRAAAGIMIVSHGVYRWIENHTGSKSRALPA